MKTNPFRLLLFVALLALLATSCSSPGFYPLYDDASTVKMPGIAGTWKAKNPQSTWQFKEEKNSYLLTYKEKGTGNPVEFNAAFVKLDGEYYVDLKLDEQSEKNKKLITGGGRVPNYLFSNGLFTVHQYAQAKMKKDTLYVKLLNFPKTDSLPVSNPDYLPYLHAERDLLIATTTQMQQFIKRQQQMKTGGYKDFFSSEAYVLVRSK